MKKYVVAGWLLFSAFVFSQKFEGLALTPPMGWNSWNHFGCDVNEALIRETADAMVSTGMKDAGYRYVNIDDCWHGKRDSLGFIHPDPDRFPSGMKALADYVHSLGLGLGIYSDAGWKTCGGRPGSRGHEYQDAMIYAKWGIDYLKYDWCYTDGLKAEGAYLTMRDALYAAGRPVVFSLCEWGNDNPWEWGKNIGHLWRTTGDIAVLFDGEVNHGTWSSWGVLQIIDMRQGIRIHAGPDHWNDPDMMEIGNGMTLSEDRAHFSMWCMLAAPLIAGNDIRHMGRETRDILTNKEAIAVNQDSLGIQGFSVMLLDSVELWAKPLMDGDLAVCFLNRAKTEKALQFDWSKNPIMDEFAEKEFHFDKAVYRIRDLWKKKSAGSTKSVLKRKIPSHDVVMLRLSR
ncbi:glycoside hydrolase family 27 protein [bacterium]|nr:glycoside hydrolase family 27 protein [bacterium]